MDSDLAAKPVPIPVALNRVTMLVTFSDGSLGYFPLVFRGRPYLISQESIASLTRWHYSFFALAFANMFFGKELLGPYRYVVLAVLAVGYAGFAFRTVKGSPLGEYRMTRKDFLRLTVDPRSNSDLVLPVILAIGCGAIGGFAFLAAFYGIGLLFLAGCLASVYSAIEVGRFLAEHASTPPTQVRVPGES